MPRARIGLLVVAIASFACSAVAQARADRSAQVSVPEGSFLHLEGVRSLGRLTRTQMIGRAPMVVTSGVRIFVPARPGLSRESLSALVRSDAGRAQRGPLASKELSVRVRSAEAGYIVELSVPSPQLASDLVREIEALLAQR